MESQPKSLHELEAEAKELRKKLMSVNAQISFAKMTDYIPEQNKLYANKFFACDDLGYETDPIDVNPIIYYHIIECTGLDIYKVNRFRYQEEHDIRIGIEERLPYIQNMKEISQRGYLEALDSFQDSVNSQARKIWNDAVK